MQTIYIDTLICVNIFMDYITLTLTKRILHINTKHSRIIIASVYGGISVLVIFLPVYNPFISIIYRIISAVIINIISFKGKDLLKLLVRTLTYFGISMLISSAVMIVELIWNPVGVIIYNDVLYFDISPAVLIITTLITYFILNIYRIIRNKHRLSCRVRTISIVLYDKNTITFESAVDTGCNLKEPFSDLPVIIVEKELIDIEKIPDNKKRIIPLNTISGSDMIIGFKPEKVFIDNKELINGCYIGITNSKLKGEIKSIISGELSEAIV